MGGRAIARRGGRGRAIGAVAAALAVGLVGTGCGTKGDRAEGPVPIGQFGGELEGTDALVGVVLATDHLTVYVCDDRTIGEWFATDVPARSVTLSSANGAEATLRTSQDEVSGTITLANGTKHAFRAGRRSAPVIHRAEVSTQDGRALAGWVTIGERTAGALVTTTTAGSTIVSPAPNLPSGGLVGLTVVSAIIPTPITTITTATLRPLQAGFPEYGKVWADDALKVVAVIGKFEPGASTSADTGIATYNTLVNGLRASLPNAVTIPSSIPVNPGVANPDVEFQTTFSGNRRIRVNVFLVDRYSEAFTTGSLARLRDRIAPLMAGADVIGYIGPEERVEGELALRYILTQGGAAVAGQYVIAFVNCCTTYGDVGRVIAETRAGRYLDVVTNVDQPQFLFGRSALTALIFRLLNRDVPASYGQILGGGWRVIDAGDNTFRPPVLPGGATSAQPWGGLDLIGTVTKAQENRFETETLAAGTFRFVLSGNGDADLYVRTGLPPSTALFDCRPAKAGSDESCLVTLSGPGRIHGMVRGFAPTSTFRLVGEPQ
jgi:hypothetical protein